jgi:hypothetical protein
VVSTAATRRVLNQGINIRGGFVWLGELLEGCAEGERAG